MDRLRPSGFQNERLEAAAREYLVGDRSAQPKADSIDARQTVAVWRVFAGFSVIYKCNGVEAGINNSNLT
jgi:hypothetical protein